MKSRSQAMVADGFDTNVAEKMPKIRKLEEPRFSTWVNELPPLQEDRSETLSQIKSEEGLKKEQVTDETPQKKMEIEPGLDVLKLIEDLHGQLLASTQTKKALEMDLATYKKTIHQLSQDNQELRRQLEVVSREHQRLKEFESESLYLQEENADALERIKELQQELRGMRETLTRANQEKEEAFHRICDLESQIKQNEVVHIKGKLKEREASLFFEENRELQSKLEEALARNLELEKKYETLKQSFNEVKESLTFLRDSCKSGYYHLTDPSE